MAKLASSGTIDEESPIKTMDGFKEGAKVGSIASALFAGVWLLLPLFFVLPGGSDAITMVFALAFYGVILGLVGFIVGGAISGVVGAILVATGNAHRAKLVSTLVTAILGLVFIVVVALIFDDGDGFRTDSHSATLGFVDMPIGIFGGLLVVIPVLFAIWIFSKAGSRFSKNIAMRQTETESQQRLFAWAQSTSRPGS